MQVFSSIEFCTGVFLTAYTVHSFKEYIVPDYSPDVRYSEESYKFRL